MLLNAASKYVIECKYVCRAYNTGEVSVHGYFV